MVQHSGKKLLCGGIKNDQKMLPQLIQIFYTAINQNQAVLMKTWNYGAQET